MLKHIALSIACAMTINGYAQTAMDFLKATHPCNNKCLMFCNDKAKKDPKLKGTPCSIEYPVSSNYKTLCFVLNAVYPDSCSPSQTCNQLDKASSNACELLADFSGSYSSGENYEYFAALNALSKLDMLSSAGAKESVKIIESFMAKKDKGTEQQRKTLTIVKATLLVVIGEQQQALSIVQDLLAQQDTGIALRYAAVVLLSRKLNIPEADKVAIISAQKAYFDSGLYNERYSLLVQGSKSELPIKK